MTTITREQQKQILIDTANHVISRDNTSPYSENLRELARIALASLEAEPIGAFHIVDQQVGGTSDYIKDGEWPIDNGVIEVYAAPPGPVVPPEKWVNPDINYAEENGFAEGWNACRAAMLQGKFRDLSQPVDPQVAEYEQIMLQAGWVMVPVEPTDEMIAAAMECDDVVFDSKDPTAFCVQYREIYCAMVDTAPKPEGNNG
ncbi:hypothetical protein LEB42_12625 [Salmonella enterica]|nr:hypothetical protein [Salmonella enterica]